MSPLENKVMCKPESFTEPEWYRFVQACKKEQIVLTDLPHVPDEIVEKLGAVTAEQRACIAGATFQDGPTPHPLIEIVRQIDSGEIVPVCRG